MRTTMSFLLVGMATAAGPAVLRADEPGDARAVVAKAMEAVGGADKLAKYHALTLTEKGIYYGMGTEQPYTGKYAFEWPNKFRMEIEGFMVMVVNGDKGWMSVAGSTDEMSKEQLAEQQENLYAGWVAHLVPLKDKAFQLTLAGEAKVGDRPAVIVKVAHKGHRDVRLFFDKENHRLLEAEYMVKAQEQGGQEVKQEAFYNDYKDVNGLKVPMKMVIKRNGKNYVEAEVTDVKLSEKLDDKVFSKP